MLRNRTKERKGLFDWKVIRIPLSLVKGWVVLVMVVVVAGAVFYYRERIPWERLPLPASVKIAFKRIGPYLGGSLGKTDGGGQTIMEQRSALLSFLDGEVKVQRNKEMNWISAKPKMKLDTGDRVRTFGGSRAEVLFDDGSVLRIKPDSLIIIGDLTENTKTKVRQSSVKLMVSSIEADIKKSVVEGSRFRLEMPSAVAEMGRAKVRVDVGPGQDSTVRVYNGRVSVDTGERKLSMGEQTQVSIGAGRQVSAVSQLVGAPRITAPRSLSRFITNDPAKVSFSLEWQAVPRASRYHLQMDSDRRFSRPSLDRKEIRGTDYRVTGLAPGVYYARVGAVDAAGLEGGFSEPAVYMVALDRTPPEVTLSKFVSSRAPGGYDVLIEGTTEPSAEVLLAGRRLVVNEQGRFSATVREVSPGEGEVPLTVRDPAGNQKTVALKVTGG